MKAIHGKIDKAVFRRSHTGEVILSKSPDMSKVNWSEAQEAHRARFREATRYAKQALDIPALHAYYLQMASERKNNNRPYDMAVSDYWKGNDLLRERGKDNQAV